MCTIGPSLPQGSDVLTTKMIATILLSSVRSVRYPVMSAPLRCDLIRGMPEC